MIDFFYHGSNIGFSLNGWSGFLLLIYILIEIFFLVITKVSFTHKILLGIRVRNQIKKMLPDWWYIEKISYYTINKRQDEYQVYVRVRCKIPTGGHHIYGDSWVEVNWLGTIKRQSLMANVTYLQQRHENEIKQWSRNKSLEDIGI